MTTLKYLVVSVVTLVLFAPICLGLDICGLENVPKCVPADLKCLSNLLESLQAWYQSPEAFGYCIDSVDPLVLNELEFDVKDTRFMLRNVTITGLSKNNVLIEEISNFEGLRYTYIMQNINFLASTFSVKDLRWGKQLNFKKPANFIFSKAKSVSKVFMSQRERCDGDNYLYIKPVQIQVHGGRTNIISGIDTVHHDVNTGEFGTALLNTVIQTCTEKLYEAQKLVFSTNPFDAFFQIK